jgi:hypothetical protein
MVGGEASELQQTLPALHLTLTYLFTRTQHGESIWTAQEQKQRQSATDNVDPQSQLDFRSY